jgi:hypothetical protein
MLNDIRTRMWLAELRFYGAVVAVVTAIVFTLALINPVGAQTRLSNCDYLAMVLAQCKATPQVLTPAAAVIPTPATYVVGVISGVSLTGAVTGATITSTTVVQLTFDGSQVQYAMTVSPVLGGGFTVQLDQHFHDAKPHVMLAMALDAKGNPQYFDNANPKSGTNGGYSFTWR